MRYLTAILLAFVLSGGSIDDDPAAQAVAVVNGHPVAEEEFKEHYIEYLLRTGMHDEARLRRAVLAQMINDRLLIADALSSGIRESQGYVQHLKTAQDKLAIELYLERAVLADVGVTQADLEEAFVRINTTLTARHLFAPTAEEAEALYARLMSGESFEALARETFADTALANNGGAIGSFTYDETDQDFEDAAYGLAVGEVSTPVRTTLGYSIIQLTDRFTQPILTESDFAGRKEKLHRLVLRKKRSLARTHFIRALAYQMSVDFHEPAFGSLLGQITGTSMIESLEAFLAEPLVSFQGGTWTVEDFRRRAQHTDQRRRAAVRSEADLERFITGLIVREELLARSEPLLKEAEYEAAVSRVMNEWVLTTKKEQLSGAVKISDDDVREHYAAYRGEFRDEDGDVLPLEDAAPRIREQLLYSRTQERVFEYIAGLRRDHDISVHEDVLLSLPIAGRAMNRSAAIDEGSEF